nr:MAG TPA: hypothetical protein [Caudoviricetes sp.]
MPVRLRSAHCTIHMRCSYRRNQEEGNHRCIN